MKSLFYLIILGFLAGIAPVRAQSSPATPKPLSIAGKLQPYIGCINRHSARIHDSESRYKSWVGKAGPTGKERIIYGLYTIYDTKDCRMAVGAAQQSQPAHAALEKAGAAFAEAIGEIEPMLKEANDYYDQKNYQDDKMAKGKAMHPKLLAAWDKFNAADASLRDIVRTLNDEVQAEELAEVEKREGRKMRWHILTVMTKAKALQRLEGGDQAKIDLAKVVPALEAYETSVKELETYSEKNPGEKLGSFFLKANKDYLATAKGLMRRVRDKTRYSQGEAMLLNGGSGGWMVEGSPPRLMRDYNQLIDAYNRGPTI
jgi:hypothetical protein